MFIRATHLDINIIRLDSFRAFREDAPDMFNPETFANLEESGLKFMPVDEYELMMEQLDGADYQIQTLKELIAERVKFLNELQVELAPLKEEQDELITKDVFMLDKWCGTCKWGG